MNAQKSMSKFSMNNVSQFAIPTLTISAQIAVAGKHPELSLIINLAAQPFWLFSGWRAWKDAKQVGIFITSLIFTIVTIFGIINYWQT